VVVLSVRQAGRRGRETSRPKPSERARQDSNLRPSD
jgi:hypothetical protein